jgi:hypothetical protein
VATGQLELSRTQILAHRRRVGALDERLRPGRASLEQAALVGLQDSMPRAALISLHARVEGTGPTTWEDPALVQVWGPRFSAYVVAERDRALFTLGRLPDDVKGRRRAEETATRLHDLLAGRRMRYDDAGAALGVDPNALRYAAPTGTLLIRWEGARRPVIWTVPRPEISASDARKELARRYLHVLGPTTPEAFATWAGIPARQGAVTFAALEPELTSVRTPIGEGWILERDVASFRAAPSPAAAARLLPSGDAYFLLQGADRQLLVPDPKLAPLLWTSRVWPGALLVGSEIVGTWRRANALVEVEPWRALAPAEKEATEAEAASLPLAGLDRPITVQWKS